MIELLITLYMITFAVITSFTAKSRNKNLFLWMLIGFLTGVFGYVTLLIFGRQNDLTLVGITNLAISSEKLQIRHNSSNDSDSAKTQGYNKNSLQVRSNSLKFEDDFVTCPNCRILSPIEADTCKVCGKDLIQ